MPRLPKNSATGLALFACLSCVDHLGSDATVEWQRDDPFKPADEAAIISLAEQVGLTDARRVSRTWWLPGGGFTVSVESAITVDGHRRTWNDLQVCPEDDASRCEWETSGEGMVRAGRWLTSRANITQREVWRIQDGVWHVDVEIGEGVPYDAAERIVLAVRRRELINRRPDHLGALKLNIDIPEVDPAGIFRIERAKSDPAGFYDVNTGSGWGFVLRVRIVDHKVELHDVATRLI